jgi:hypothetical protein
VEKVNENTHFYNNSKTDRRIMFLQKLLSKLKAELKTMTKRTFLYFLVVALA